MFSVSQSSSINMGPDSLVSKEELTATGNNLSTQFNILNNNTGNYYPRMNPSGFARSGILSNYVTISGLNATGEYLENEIAELKSRTGLYLTGLNATGYATATNLYNTGANLLGLITSLNNVTGTFYAKNNPSGYIGTGSLTGYVNKSNTGNFLTSFTPGFTRIQRTRLSTDINGNATWIYPSGYTSGITPIVQLTVENNNLTIPYDHKITAINNTGVTIKTLQTSLVSVVGISVLGIPVGAQCFVHLTAFEP